MLLLLLPPVLTLVAALWAGSAWMKRNPATPGVPPGYEEVGRAGRFTAYGRRGNPAAPPAARILHLFTKRVLAEYGAALSLAPGDTSFEVIVFSSDDDLSAFGREHFHSDLSNNRGFYLPEVRTVGVVGARDPLALARPLFHEGTHLVLAAWTAGEDHAWSRWLNEGLASWFEGSEHENGVVTRLGGLRGWLVEHARRAARAGRWPTVADLFTAPTEVWEGPDNATWYSKALILVDYLLRGQGRDPTRFFEWFELERRPGPATLAEFEAVFGPAAELDRALLRYVQTLP